MGSLDQSYLKSLQGNQEADLLAWASKQPETFDTPAEQAKMNPPKVKKSTWKDRAFKTGAETLADPESTWLERGLAGASQSVTDSLTRAGGALHRGSGRLGLCPAQEQQ